MRHVPRDVVEHTEGTEGPNRDSPSRSPSAASRIETSRPSTTTTMSSSSGFSLSCQSRRRASQPCGGAWS
jgi:hypothetical protein